LTREPLAGNIIVYKLKYYVLGRMPKHLRDIGTILTASDDALDPAYTTRCPTGSEPATYEESFWLLTPAPGRESRRYPSSMPHHATAIVARSVPTKIGSALAVI